MAVLQQLEKNTQGLLFKLATPSTVVGRDDNCDLTITSPAVSRFHARIFQEQSRYFVEDLKSRNGTSLNGRRISAKEVLHDGDLIDFSTNRFVFYSQTSLDEATGQWTGRKEPVRISGDQSDSDASIRHAPVRAGDTVPSSASEEIRLGGVRQARISAAIRVSGAHVNPLVAADASRKLLQVLQLVQALRRTISVSDALAIGLDKLFTCFPGIDRIAIVQGAHGTADHRVLAAAGRQPDEVIHLCYPLISQCMHLSEALLYVDQWRNDNEQQPRLSELSTRHVLVAPLTAGDHSVVGAIQMDADGGDRTPDTSDLERLAVLAQVLSFSLELAGEFEREAAKNLLERSTAIDRDQRIRLAAVQPPRVPGYLFRHQLIAARGSTGDMVDYSLMSGGRIAVVLIDVPGKGPEAVSLMACLGRLISGALVETGSAAEAIQETERGLLKRMSQVPLTISVAIVVFDPNRGSAVISVAGRCPILKLSPGSATELSQDGVSGPPLGEPRGHYRETEIVLDHRESLLIFNDGIERVLSPDGAALSRSRLAEIIRSNGDNPEQFDRRLRDQIGEFRQVGPVHKNLAFAVIHRLSADDIVIADFDAERGVPKGES